MVTKRSVDESVWSTVSSSCRSSWRTCWAASPPTTACRSPSCACSACCAIVSRRCSSSPTTCPWRSPASPASSIAPKPEASSSASPAPRRQDDPRRPHQGRPDPRQEGERAVTAAIGPRRRPLRRRAATSVNDAPQDAPKPLTAHQPARTSATEPRWQPNSSAAGRSRASVGDAAQHADPQHEARCAPARGPSLGSVGGQASPIRGCRDRQGARRRGGSGRSAAEPSPDPPDRERFLLSSRSWVGEMRSCSTG